MPGAFAKHAVEAQPDEQRDEREDDDGSQGWTFFQDAAESGATANIGAIAARIQTALALSVPRLVPLHG